MNKGQWYLVYGEFDGLENSYSDALRTEKTRLNATTEDEAISEASSLWKERLAKGTYVGWGNKDVHYPNSPRVIYEIPLL